MTTLREASLIALEFLEALGENHWLDRKATMAALREALAEPEPEPLCTAAMFDDAFLAKSGLSPDTKLYTTPPQRKPLTMEQLRDIREHQRLIEELGPVWAPTLYYFCQAIERAHGIRGEE